jgi:hypothetical protein
MKIELDGISLNETQSQEGGVAEARSVSNVHATDNRNVVLHTVPGMEGSAIQDLGRTAVRVSFDGIVMGASAKNIVEMLRSKFKLGEPVLFNSDVSGTADVTKVVIDEFKVANVAGNKDRFDYSIRLREFKEPPQQQSTPPSQDGAAAAWADGAAEETGQSINTTTGTVAGGEEEPAAGVEVTATGEDDEEKLEGPGTDEEGHEEAADERGVPINGDTSRPAEKPVEEDRPPIAAKPMQPAARSRAKDKQADDPDTAGASKKA